MIKTNYQCLRLALVGVLTGNIVPAGSPKESEQRILEQACDKLGIRHSSSIRTDHSERLLAIPQNYPEVRDFEVAKSPPTVEFSIVQGLDPEYLPEPGAARSHGNYGGWGDVTKGPDGCFYFSIGNHMSYDGGNADVIRYDPATKSQRVVLRTRQVIGWGPDDFADGKLHGDLDIGPDGNMWALTYFGPGPTQKEWDTVYRGGSLIRYNVLTGGKENLGIPLEGDSWPYHAWDWQRGLFFGVGNNGYVIAYDTKARKMLYGGAPPMNICWFARAVMLDRETGVFYATDSPSTKQERHQFVSYKRRNNQFTRMKSETPPNPVTGRSGALRAHTKRKDAKGAFWCFDHAGTFFRFYPAEDRVELVGVNWGRSGKYTPNMELSPGGRYVYYVPGAGGDGYPYGTALVQYDTRENRKKVIAFLYDFYLDKYGYGAAGTYGIELDQRGESAFIYTNGRFTTRERGTGYGRPAIFHIRIPASERIE